MLVEDNKVNRKLAIRLLEKGEAQVEVAEDGAQALAKLAVHRFDLVLMDVRMPVLGGLEATAQIRAGSADVLQPDVPIVALTANAFQQSIDECLAAGMNACVAKPINKRELFEVIAREAKP